jgi:alpha-glucosidase
MAQDWWRGGVFYQIYPRSFKDSNDDGIGDLKGILEKIDYIASLGVEGIWISPFLKSPMKDFGYDVSDYRDVDPLFGTLDDFKTLLAEAHKRGLKIIMDMVFSHTSEEHPWFQESHKSRDNPKADWYVWADPREDGNPPNNWLSLFGGSAWQYDSWRGQYYLHNFLKEQPDLNFHNPAVQQEILDISQFWLDMGIDGFRLDVINFCFHDKLLRDNPPRPVEEGAYATQLTFPDPYSMQWHVHDKSQPEMLEFVKKLRALVDQYPDTMMLGEIGDDHSTKRSIEYASGEDKLHTCYSFNLVLAKPWNVQSLKDAVTDFESQAGDAWPSWAMSNHDVVRAASRWTEDYKADPATARMLIALMTCLRGTPFLYQGEELGLPETLVAYEDLQDPWGKYLYPKWQGRDGCRTPMPWEANRAQHGFSEAKPWLPANPAYADFAADLQEKDPRSTLNFVRAFLKWRKGQKTLIKGRIEFIESGHKDVLAFRREISGETCLCLFNFSEQEIRMPLPESIKENGSFEWPGQTGQIQNAELILPRRGFYIG